MSTIVFIHAHPDDEALLTGGTMALLARAGHRVVLATATAGEAGLAETATPDLGRRRADELARAAALLGCARTVLLGYPDSGMRKHPVARPDAFARQPVHVPARRLAELLCEEQADAVCCYDPAGGYGHPDHVQVHRIGLAAAELARTPVVLQATVDRRALQRALRMLSFIRPDVPELRPGRYERLFTAHELITHRVDVGAVIDVKRAAMSAHVSQGGADDGERMLARFLRLPPPAFRLVFGREWFVEAGRESHSGGWRCLTELTHV